LPTFLTLEDQLPVRWQFFSTISHLILSKNYLWLHPAQQHGLRSPALNFESIIFILRSLVSIFFADSIQQIHSLRASGVISSHVESAFTEEVSAFCKSSGISCSVPLEITFLNI
jgi:hypothetical protein